MLGYIPLVLAGFALAVWILHDGHAANSTGQKSDITEIIPASIAVATVLVPVCGFILSRYGRFTLAGWSAVFAVIFVPALAFLIFRPPVRRKIFQPGIDGIYQWFRSDWAASACIGMVFAVMAWYILVFWVPYPGSSTASLFNQAGKHLAQTGMFPSLPPERISYHTYTIYFPPAASYLSGYLRLWGNNTASNFAGRAMPVVFLLGIFSAFLLSAKIIVSRAAGRNAGAGVRSSLAACLALAALSATLNSYETFVALFEITADTIPIFLSAYFAYLTLSLCLEGRPRTVEFAMCICGMFWSRAHYAFAFLAVWAGLLAWRFRLCMKSPARLSAAAAILASGFLWMTWCRSHFGSPLFPYEFPPRVLALADKIGFPMRNFPGSIGAVETPPDWKPPANKPVAPAGAGVGIGVWLYNFFPAANNFGGGMGLLSFAAGIFFGNSFSGLMTIAWFAGIIAFLRSPPALQRALLPANLVFLSVEAAFIFGFAVVMPGYAKFLYPLSAVAPVHCMLNLAGFFAARPFSVRRLVLKITGVLLSALFVLGVFLGGMGTLHWYNRWGPLRVLLGRADAVQVKSGDDLPGFIAASRALNAQQEGILHLHMEPGIAFNHLADGLYYWQEWHFWSAPMSPVHFLKGRALSDFFRRNRVRYFFVSYDPRFYLATSRYPEYLLKAILAGDPRFPVALKSPNGAYRLYQLY